ncbi:MAG: hypothetical protein HY769_09050 [Candidatus Stahlbacteria bacterium]|nr:hypothetical protein [Candidatus Stahlbacteria bacterium]
MEKLERSRNPARPAPAVNPAGKNPKAYLISLKPKNWLFIGIGVIFIVVGFLLLAKGSMTLAPILLVLGFCVLIPLGIILK